MLASDVEQLAKFLIKEFAPVGYTFGWNNLKKVNGQCCYGPKRIELSRHLTPLRTPAAIRQTIMHEIAHALHPGAGHGTLWKRQMIAFGLPPDRCSKDVVDKSSISNWRAVCWNCGNASYQIRKPRKTRSCGKCSNVYEERYKLTFLPM